MKKGLIALSIAAVMALAAANLFAQGYGRGFCGGPGGGKGYGPGMGFRHIEAMKSELGLSDEQEKKIFDIGTKFREKYFENRGNNDKIESLRNDHRKEIEKVLTKEQAEKFKSGFGGGNRRGGCCGGNNT